MNNLKPLFSLGLALLFVIIGIYLINKSQIYGIENGTLYLIAGVACVVFFGGIMILGLFKLVRK